MAEIRELLNSQKKLFDAMDATQMSLLKLCITEVSLLRYVTLGIALTAIFHVDNFGSTFTYAWFCITAVNTFVFLTFTIIGRRLFNGEPLQLAYLLLASSIPIIVLHTHLFLMFTIPLCIYSGVGNANIHFSIIMADHLRRMFKSIIPNSTTSSHASPLEPLNPPTHLSHT